MSGGGAEKRVLFRDFGLDDRLLKAVAKLGWDRPTLVQEKAILLALEGKDLLIRAQTGSGKTAAYCLPLLHKILQAKAGTADHEPSVVALVLVPSKELCSQATKNIKELSLYCSSDVRVFDVCAAVTTHTLRSGLMENPDIVVATPSKALTHIQKKSLLVKESLQQLVLDEADLLFSHGYEESLRLLLPHLPSILQSTLLSATLSQDVETLKRLTLHNPVILKVNDENEGAESRLTQFQIKCCAEDKFLLIYTLLKLGLIRGKTLLFVNQIDSCYRLRLFLERFSIKSCVLNSELPHNSRYHTVEQFNCGVYDYIIATDEAHGHSRKAAAGPGGSGKEREMGRKRKRDLEYGVSRGIDFQGVENVVNFDFPLTSDAYVHRVGRTARGFDYGTALSLVSPAEEPRLAEVERRLKKEAIGAESPVVKPYRFRMSEIEGFRYRVMDVLRAVTKARIREARLKEIRVEMLNSEKLKSHFEDNPRDLAVLRHDHLLQPNRVQPHLKHIPDYLVPKALQAASGSEEPKRKMRHVHSNTGRRPARRKKARNDPLKTFTSKPRKGWRV